MKIAILTLPPRNNYGGILQAWALYNVLKKEGHQVELISGRSRRFDLPWMKKPLVYTKRFLLKYLLGKKNLLIFMERDTDKMFALTERFIQTNIPIHYYNSFKEIHENDYDAYIVGSDQIWRKMYIPHIQDSFLEFAVDWNVKRVAYAPSFGTDEWEYNETETKDCQQLLAKFDGVSCREDSGNLLIEKHLGRKSLLVLDPTLLLDRADYLQILNRAPQPTSAGNLLCYLLTYNDVVRSKVEKIANEYQLKPFNVFADYSNSNLKLEERIQPALETWLKGFDDTKVVVTDSFHATVFSILFQKPFILFDSGRRGNARIESLLRMTEFDISAGVFNRIHVPTANNIDAVKALRGVSMNFLKESLI